MIPSLSLDCTRNDDLLWGDLGGFDWAAHGVPLGRQLAVERGGRAESPRYGLLLLSGFSDASARLLTPFRDIPARRSDLIIK